MSDKLIKDIVTQLRHGANPDAIAVNGDSALLFAVCTNNPTLTGVLLAAGADPITSLLLAVAINEDARDCASLLLAAGAVWSPELHASLDPKFEGDDWVSIVRHADAAKRELKLYGLAVCRDRAFEICVGLQSLGVPAPQLIEIVTQDCEAFAARLPFHLLWNITCAIKHFHQRVHVPQVRVDLMVAARDERCRLLRATELILNQCRHFRLDKFDEEANGDERSVAEKVAICASALEVRTRVLGEHHIDTQRTKFEHALLLAESRDLFGANALLESLSKEYNDDDGYVIARIKGLLAFNLTECGEYVRAAAIYEFLFETHRQLDGENAWLTRAAKLDLARNHHNLGKLAHARVMMEELVASAVEEKPPIDEIWAKFSLAAVLRDMRDYRGAKALLEDVIALERNELGGADDVGSLFTQCVLGDVMRLLGEVAEAEKLLEAAVPSQRTPDGDGSEELWALRCMGMLRHAQGRFEEAVSLLEPLVDIEARARGRKSHQFFEFRFEHAAALWMLPTERERARVLLPAIIDEFTQADFGVEHHRAAEMRATLDELLNQ
jgi:hypothetical protein